MTVLPPRPLLALCVLLVGLLAWSVAARSLPAVPVRDAERWEGQAVRMEGWAGEVRQDGRGHLRLLLVDEGHAIELRTPVPPTDKRPGLGDRIEAAGRLTRWQGALRLDVDSPQDLRIVGGPRPIQPDWSDLAADPDAWEGTPIRLTGRVEDGQLVGERASLAIGEGPWPATGTVVATGLLRFDPACVCHRLDAREVRPWTP